MQKIEVKTDITADQLQPNSGDSFQVIVTTETPISGLYDVDSKTKVKGDNMVESSEATMTLGELKELLAYHQGIADTTRAKIDLVQSAVDAAINNLKKGI